jgi:hypothetical protein
MEAGVLNFTPEEYQILEDIEFDETIERPESIRFYTLEEQTTDAYEKLIPRGRSTRFQRDKVRKDVDRLQDLYEKYVSILPETYALREPELSVDYDWVSPVYKKREGVDETQLRAYNWDTQLLPLYDNLRQPNFIPDLIAAFPHPFDDPPEGTTPYKVQKAEDLATEDGKRTFRGLPDYAITRTQYHEDKTISIVLDPVEGSGDKVGFLGYYLYKRPVDIPNPLLEHPFLNENKDTFLPSTAPLKDVVPSIDAVLTHAIPVTKDPYGEAAPYLKVWDVKLSSIPWSAWKSKFPPVDPVNATGPAEPIEFPKPGQLAVPEKIQDIYGVPYSPGMSVRLWLMNRVDGGGLVADLLRSTAIDNGSVNIVPGVDLPKAAYPESTVEACSLEGKSFPEFLTTGILRRSFVGDKPKYQCVPLEFIKQERAQLGYAGRLPWKETTGDAIKKAYLKRLSEVTPPPELVAKEPAAVKSPVRAESVRRAEILAILSDGNRYAEDKLRDIRELLTETTLSNNIYSDPDGAFVICSHTLALLGGDLAADRQKYYDTWTARVDGFRVCKFCGEQINADVYEEVNEYDEDGFLIRNAEALEGPGHHATGVVDYVSGLRKLQPLFMLQTPHDDAVFLVLSLLQVLPTADVLEQFLGLGRQVAAVQFNKGSADQISRFQGMTGLATAALILQCHIPTLIPRRSFGPRPLILSGYPRDAPAPTSEYTIVDTLITVLRKTFEAFPTTFGGPAKALLKGILNKPGEVKNTVTALLSAKSPLLIRKKPDGKTESTFVAELLVRAKAYVAEKPPVEVPKTLIPVMAPPKEFDVITSFPSCPSARPIWMSGRLPQVTQAAVSLRPGIQAAAGAEPVPPTVSDRVVPVAVEKAQIRARLATGARLSSRIRVSDDYRTSLMIASRLADMFRQPSPVRSVDPNQNAAELRDIAKGLAYEQLADIQTAVAKQTQLEERRTQDVSLYLLQADYKEEKSQANKLRATERLKIVEDLKRKSDTERELIQQLLSIGAAPYLVSRSDREMFAREAELLQEQIRAEEDELDRAEEADAEVGVGAARDYADDGDEDERGVDHGDYGDRAGLPVDRDYPVAGLGDDPSRSI